MNNKRIFFISLTLFAAIIACAIPGLPTASAPSPAPTVDTSRILSTMVAETVSAAIALTEQAFPTLTVADLTTDAAVSPVPISETFTPSSIPSIPFSSYGTALQKQADASTLFMDQIAGYQFVVPAVWTLVRPNEQEYFELLSLPIAGNPTVQKTLDSMKTLDSNTFRAYGFDFRDGHILENFIINFDVTLAKDLKGSYQDIFDQIEESYANPELINKFTVLSSAVIMTPGNVEAGVIEFEIDGTSSTPDLKLYEKQVILRIQSGGYLVIRFDTTYEFKDLTLSEFEQLISSLKPDTP